MSRRLSDIDIGANPTTIGTPAASVTAAKGVQSSFAIPITAMRNLLTVTFELFLVTFLLGFLALLSTGYAGLF